MTTSVRSGWWWSSLFVLALGGSDALGGPTFVVDDDAPFDPAPGDASISDPLEDGSFQHPFDSIQEAIDAAVDGDIILVLAGTYFEAITLRGKAITLGSADGPGMTTIDATGLGRRVVSCVTGEGPDTQIIGFTITGGEAFTGGGMFNLNASPTVIGCVFTANRACVGGGMMNDSASPTVRFCQFVANLADADGGGIYNFNTNDFVSQPLIEDCVFLGNIAEADGGGMWSSSNSVVIATPTITRCIFVGNLAREDGGGLWNATANPTITSCQFLGNNAVGSGGGTWMQNTQLTMTNCTYSGNLALGDGAAIDCETSSPRVTNCSFSLNIADFDASGDGNGGGFFNSDGAARVANCVFWGNQPEQVFDSIGVPADVSYCNVQGGWPGLGNIDADPLFVDAEGPDSTPGTFDDDLRLMAGSPCIDAGANNALPQDAIDLDMDADLSELLPLDLDGNARFSDVLASPDAGCGNPVVVDIGAYEVPGAVDANPVVYADVDGSGTVDFDDILNLLLQFGPCASCCTADVTFDGVVNFEDLLIVLAVYEG
jgi:hypothetical protein